MRAYLIDPVARTVSDVDFDGGPSGIHRLLDVDCFDCARFDTARGLTGDVVYVDDEGLLRPDRAWFWISGYYAPLAGRGLVVGTTSGGNSRPPRHSLDEIRAAVEFGEPVRLKLPGAPARVLWMPAQRGGRVRSLEGL